MNPPRWSSKWAPPRDWVSDQNSLKPRGFWGLLDTSAVLPPRSFCRFSYTVCVYANTMVCSHHPRFLSDSCSHTILLERPGVPSLRVAPLLPYLRKNLFSLPSNYSVRDVQFVFFGFLLGPLLVLFASAFRMKFICLWSGSDGSSDTLQFTCLPMRACDPRVISITSAPLELWNVGSSPLLIISSSFQPGISKPSINLPARYFKTFY